MALNRAGTLTVVPRVRKVPIPSSASASRLRFAARCREERNRQGLTLEDLADKSGLTWSYISQVERGIRNISVDNMDRLAGALGLSLRDLL